jgi:surface carbohydrate biosynthesis protein (TIGR04326 family)
VAVAGPESTPVDRYFRELPKELRAAAVRVAWFTWLDPDSEPGKENRRLDDVVEPARQRDDVVILQNELTAADIARAYLAFGALTAYVKSRRLPSLRRAFISEGLDYFPLFDTALIQGFAGARVPNCELVLKATRRALDRYKPYAFVSFLEHFPYARSQYAACRSASVKSWIVQHASYCNEKTFLRLSPSVESAGVPDSLACPTADAVCAAGDLAAQMFLDSGYRATAVSVTGSPRYDHVILRNAVARATGGPRILLATSLAVEPQIDMIEAVVAATSGLETIELVLRNHPFQAIHRNSRLAPLRGRFVVSEASLQEDLDSCDVVIFSYSTVAEEAFLAGRPVWQWLPRGFNGSALAAVWPIPQFSTISDLRDALERSLKFGFEPPAPDAQAAVASALFGPCDGRAAERVAAAITRDKKRS